MEGKREPAGEEEIEDWEVEGRCTCMYKAVGRSAARKAMAVVHFPQKLTTEVI